MYKHILVATDLSVTGKKPVLAAKKLAEKFGAKLSLVHVVEPISAYGFAAYYPGVVELEKQRAEEARNELRELGNELGVSSEDQYIEIGSTKESILELCEDKSCDLIVVGSHGRNGLAMLLGSTANAILHGAKVDVLTIRFEDK